MDVIEVTRTPEGALEFTSREVPDPVDSPAGEDMHDGNVHTVERAASLVGGSALLVGGLRRGGLAGFCSALLGAALMRRGATGYSPTYDALGIDTSGDADEEGALSEFVTARRAIHIEAVTTVDSPASELYRLWREPLNLPRFMKSLTSVHPIDDRRAEWTLKPPVGPAIHFETEITHEREGEHLAWRSGASAVVEHAGEVRFRELAAGRGTEVRLKMDFTPPGGALGGGLAKLFDGAMELQLRAELKRMKQFMETGEIATTEGQPAARNR